MSTKHTAPNYGTSQAHNFQVAGCTSQWHRDHKSGECWTAFLRYHGAPDGLNIDEFYDGLNRGGWR